jgi:hypothetical protein
LRINDQTQKITAEYQYHGGTLGSAQLIGKLGLGDGKTELERPHALRLRRSGLQSVG